MSPALAISQLLETEESRGEGTCPMHLPRFFSLVYVSAASTIFHVAIHINPSRDSEQKKKTPWDPVLNSLFFLTFLIIVKPFYFLLFSQGVLAPDSTLAITVSRVGTPTQKFYSGTLAQLSQLPEEAFGGPLHSLVIVGKRVHPLEVEYAGGWAVEEEGNDAQDVKRDEQGKRVGEWWRVARDVLGVELEGESR